MLLCSGMLVSAEHLVLHLPWKLILQEGITQVSADVAVIQFSNPASMTQRSALAVEVELSPSIKWCVFFLLH